jgi:hypothetical protein
LSLPLEATTTLVKHFDASRERAQMLEGNEDIVENQNFVSF